MSSVFWKIIDRVNCRYPTMKMLADVSATFGDTQRRARYQEDQCYRLFEFFNRESSNLADAKSNGSRAVLFAGVRGSVPLVTAFEGVLARALQMRGAKVSTFACDGVLQRCDAYLLEDRTQEKCLTCSVNSRRYNAALCLDHHRLSDFVRPGDWDEATQLSQGIGDSDLDHFEIDQIRLGKLANYSVRYNTGQNRLVLTEEVAKLNQEFLANGLLLFRAYQRLLDSIRPKAVVMLNGLYMSFRILRDLALERGIPVYTYERSYRRDAWVFNRNGFAALNPIDSAWDSLKDLPLNSKQEDELNNYLASRAAGTVQDSFALNVCPKESVSEIWSELRLDASKPTATLFPSSLCDSTTMDFDGVFPSIYDWIAE